MIRLMTTQPLRAEESDAFFRTLLDSAPDAMIIVDDDGKIVVVNGQTERMFGYDRQEILDQSIASLNTTKAIRHSVCKIPGSII